MEEFSSVKVDWDHIMSMSTRLRQHLDRVHSMHAKDDLAKEMKSHSRTILCELLHDRPAGFRHTSDKVCMVTVEFCFWHLC